ncbi:hypothetical protein J6S88_06805 [bacterium]|nr:hypothetical protein [bacterium]
MDLTVNTINTKSFSQNKSPNFRGEIYAYGLNEYQKYACQKVLPKLKRIMRWRLCDLNIINNKTVIMTLDGNRTSDIYSFTKLQLQNKISQNVVAEENIALSPFQPEEIITTVKKLFKIKNKRIS